MARRVRRQARQRVAQLQLGAVPQTICKPVWLNGDAGTTRVNLGMSMPMPVSGAAGVTAFSAEVNGVARNLSAATFSSAMTVTLTLSSATVLGDLVKIVYDGTGNLQSAGGSIAAAAFSCVGEIAQS